MKSLSLICCLIVLSSISSLAETDTYTISIDSISNHVHILAADSMAGRKVGEAGEMKAANYIAGVFKAAGLLPHGDAESYLLSFGFTKLIDLGKNNWMVLNGDSLELNEEFSPMRQSASMAFAFDTIIDVGYGITTDDEDGQYNDYEGLDVNGKAVLIKRFSPSADEFPHVNFDRYSTLTNKIITAQGNGAAGVIFVTPQDRDDTITTLGATRISPREMPILFLRRKALQRLKLDISNPLLTSASGEIELIKVRDTGYNVVGYLPGEVDTAIVYGAHYDHLGWGGEGSLYPGTDKQIHNGADDNASGVAGLLELARYHAHSTSSRKYSRYFVAFSGEEAGLLGSSNFVKSGLIDTAKVRLMINMDMIGRLHKKEDTTLVIFGVGTAEEFGPYFDSTTFHGLTLSFKEPGTGPSDQTSFYNRGIPVLFFFTGAHNDYHKPSDDADLVDFEGIATVAELVRDVTDHFETYDGALTFQKTKDPAGGRRSAQFSVTLGVMPDYVTEVTGLKIDGVSPERPGDMAGIKAGDIIIRMGQLNIGDIYDYMHALGKYRKGDSCEVIVARGGDTLSLLVRFE